MKRITVWGKELLWGDVLLGFGVGLYTAFWCGWWSVLVAVICGFLWAMGGQFGHSYRVFGIPAAMWWPIFWAHGRRWSSALPCILIGVALSEGYGMPDFPGKKDADPGSPWGRLWWNIVYRFHPGPIFTSREAWESVSFWATIPARGFIVLAVLASMSGWFYLIK